MSIAVEKFFWEGCGHLNNDSAEEIRSAYPVRGKPFTENTFLIGGIQRCKTCLLINSSSNHKHMACEHVFADAQNIMNVEVHDAMLDPTAIRFEPGVIITHPRWCDTCVRRRTGLILQNHRHVAGYQGTKSDQEIYQLSWSKGMRDGRIEAETMDWKNNTDVIKVSDTMLNNPSNDDLMLSMMGVVTIDEDPVMQALAERIAQIPVGASDPNTNAFAFNPEYTRLELAFAYNEGRLEGMNYQLNLEAIVLQGQRGNERFRALDETTGPYDVSLRNLVIERDVVRFLNSRV